MARVKLKANKLENPSVSYISLVSRGANRIPFRIIKLDKEQEMLDLNGLFRREPVRKEEPSTPAIEATLVGLVVEKSDRLEEVASLLSEAGFTTDNREEGEDNTVVFKQADEIEGATIFKLNDQMLALVKGVNPEEDLSDLSFVEVHKEHGFLPSVELAGQFTMNNVLALSASEDEERVQKSAGAIEELQVYTAFCNQVLPAKVVKAASDVDVLMQNPPEEKPEETPAAEATPNAEEPVAKTDEEVPAAEATPEATPEVSEQASPVTPESVQEMVQKSVEGILESVKEMVVKANADIAEALSHVSKTVEGLSEQVSGIKEQGETLATKMAEVESVAKSAEQSVKGTVVGAEPADDRQVRKQENHDPRSGVFDTAFLPRKNQARR